MFIYIGIAMCHIRQGDTFIVSWGDAFANRKMGRWLEKYLYSTRTWFHTAIKQIHYDNLKENPEVKESVYLSVLPSNCLLKRSRSFADVWHDSHREPHRRAVKSRTALWRVIVMNCLEEKVFSISRCLVMKNVPV